MSSNYSTINQSYRHLSEAERGETEAYLYTGGAFGAEGSILVLCVVFILTVALLQRACREELAHKGDWLFWYQKNAQDNLMHFFSGNACYFLLSNLDNFKQKNEICPTVFLDE